MNYLELCQDFVGQFGLAGGTGPDDVSGQTGELANVVRWIRDADLYVCNLWEDWRFLWVAYAGNLNADLSAPTAPASPAGVRVRLWETHTIKTRAPTETVWSAPLAYWPRDKFDAMYDPDTATAGRPEAFTVMPDNTLKFDRPADVQYSVKGSFYRSPPPLAANDSVSLIPEEYHRLILVRACIMYADREDAPELVNGATAEYPDLLEKLESAHLDGFRGQRRSTAPDDQNCGGGWL